MDHIWGAPSGVKKSIIFIFWEKKAVTFGPQFPKTLYTRIRTSLSRCLVLLTLGRRGYLNQFHCSPSPDLDLDLSLTIHP